MSDKKIKAAFVQLDSKLGDAAANIDRLQTLLDKAVAEQADVVVFPELWDVGFFPKNIAELAEEEENHSALEWMRQAAKTHRINVVGGSIAVKDGVNVFNRAYVFDREGRELARYDKTHLFSPGRETDYFTPGQETAAFELEGVPSGVIICYDMRFPELMRKQVLNGAKMMFVPAQWPHPRSGHWLTLARARAIENQVFVVAVNGCGKAGALQSCGHSVIYTPWGEEVVAAGEEEGVYTAELDLRLVDEARGKIPVLEDRNMQAY